MIKKKVLIIYREDSGLKLEKLVNKIGNIPQFYLGASEKKESLANNSVYFTACVIAKGRGANVLVIDEETQEHLRISLYKDSKINIAHPEELFKSAFGVNSANEGYCIAKSIDYTLSKR